MNKAQTQKRLTWLQSLKKGDEIAIGYPHNKPWQYTIGTITKINSRTITTTSQLGRHRKFLSKTGQDQYDDLRIVPITKQIRNEWNRSQLYWDLYTAASLADSLPTRTVNRLRLQLKPIIAKKTKC